MNDYEICWEQRYFGEDLECRLCPHRFECAGSDWISEGKDVEDYEDD